MYLQQRAGLEQRDILDADDIQEIEPTFSDNFSNKLTTLNGLLEFGGI